ncbi:hypothetical protein MHYP_G00250290 [Metynnis hypsauchen]
MRERPKYQLSPFEILFGRPPITGTKPLENLVLKEAQTAEMLSENVPLTWTNQTSTQTSASKTLTIVTHPAPVSEMEGSRAVLITLTCVLFSRISGEEVEMRVRPGDAVILYSDCLQSASKTVWFRNSSNEHQPPLNISSDDCSACWKLLVSVCPVCVLLSSTCAYCIYRNTTKEKKKDGEGDGGNKENPKSTNSNKEQFSRSQTQGGDVCYASLDLPSQGQNWPKKKKRDQSSDFTTYSEVKTAKM